MKSNLLVSNQNKYAMQASLMKLYAQYGYRQVSIPACEPLATISELEKQYPSRTQVKFMDQSGEIFYLQDDPTVSVMKMLRLSSATNIEQKICYYAPTYKWGHRQLNEETQIGVETFGKDTLLHDLEIIVLAVKSLRLFTDKVMLDIGDVSFLETLLESMPFNSEQIQAIVKALPSKNMMTLKELELFQNIKSQDWDLLASLFKLFGPTEIVLENAKQLIDQITFKDEQLQVKLDTILNQIRDRSAFLKAYDLLEYTQLDFTLKPELKYYNGLVLKGFIKNCPSEVLNGGRYDQLSTEFGKANCAAGFALTLDLLMNYTEVKKMTRKNSLLLLETELSAKGIKYAEYYRQKGFEVNLRTYETEKEAIDLASKENFEKVILFGERSAKVIDIRKDNVQKMPYSTFDQYLTITDANKSIH
ncbi:ATP phosphoribosyltransferase regulatory subunit [Fusibacter ferrireducens]|uniref:ATP phosphoribosyltransferase regulatory subunit n=1 Tax=Fusibacter ferrireducens TaxID=2785058 RepID=A0ABR9ZUN6_9FIRM|nr:ATP phosphoribosyltransferase regulatory subunit [Fusibacter ferrireducens]MBF4694148.1 ATP phosphoribosyltransferase regulatory subunit [Fusibacter ferrireducens]